MRTTGNLIFALLFGLALQGQAATLVAQNGWGRIERLDTFAWEPVGIPDLTLLGDDVYAAVQPLPFTVTWGGQSYSRFHMGTNGDVELLGPGDIPASPGFGSLSGLPSTSTFLLNAYDDLVGRVTYEDRGDRVVFNYSVITYADDEDFADAISYLNTFQAILHDSGVVEWNFLDGNFSGFGYDLATGIQLANQPPAQRSLFAVTGDIPAFESYRLTPVPLPLPLLLMIPPMSLLLLAGRRPSA